MNNREIRRKINEMCNNCKYQSTVERYMDDTFVCKFNEHNPSLVARQAAKTGEIKCEQYDKI